MNKYREHVYVIPEDDADRQIAVGFVDHHRVDVRRIQIMPVAGGWSHVLSTFREEYLLTLRNFPTTHVVLLIDFDGQVENRKQEFEQAIPEDVKARVFVVGSCDEPETLKSALNIGFEQIGKSLAEDCDKDTVDYWSHEQLQHNDAERKRLILTVKPFLFQADD